MDESACQASRHARSESGWSAFEIPDEAASVLVRLNECGYESYLVGGCVRDYLLGHAPKDYDVTTNAPVEQIKAVFQDRKVIETGIKHGTVTVLSGDMPIEVTTYRVDGRYSDGRHPDSVTFSSRLQDDLSRRDFTMNAVAYSPRDGWMDVFGGIEDIRSGVIRCVGEPDRRFEEDALRILRALRFASVLGFAIEPHTAESLHRNRRLLNRIAKERVTAELFGLLKGQGAAAVLRAYSDVAAEILPPLAPMFGCAQDNPHHIYDVWEHTLQVVEHVPPDVVLRMAALLHDIGKPHCRTTDENGVGHFYGHAAIGCDMAQEIFQRYLRTDKATSERILTLVKHHDEPFAARRSTMRRRLAKHGEEVTRQLLLLARGDTLGQSPSCFGRLEELDSAERLLDELLEEQSCCSLKDLCVNGHDLMVLGVTPGRQMGEILHMLLEEVCEERLPNEREALLIRAKEWYDKEGNS